MNQFVKFGHGTSNTLPAGVPNGYLKAVFFDKAGNVQAAESQVKYLQTSVSSWQTLELSFTASQNGYLQVYVANESDQEVFFDELEVAHTPTLIAQENHYYPYGMNMVGIEKQGMPHHRFQFNAQTERETSFHLHWDETPFRRYDAQIGRFHGVDALASEYAGITPYQYAFNNPVMFNDPTGLLPDATASFGSPGSTFMDEWAAGQAGGSHLQNDFGGNEDVNAFITVDDLMGAVNPVILGYRKVVDGNTTYHNLPIRGFEFRQPIDWYLDLLGNLIHRKDLTGNQESQGLLWVGGESNGANSQLIQMTRDRLKEDPGFTSRIFGIVERNRRLASGTAESSYPIFELIGGFGIKKGVQLGWKGIKKLFVKEIKAKSEAKLINRAQERVTKRAMSKIKGGASQKGGQTGEWLPLDEAVDKLKGNILKHKKRVEEVGTGAGRSGGHGIPHKRTAAELQRLANDPNLLPEYREALKKAAKRLLEQGKGHSHKN